MLTFRPRDALLEDHDCRALRSYWPAEWFLLYQHFALRFAQLAGSAGKAQNPLKMSDPHDLMRSQEAPRKRLAAHFLSVGNRAWEGGVYLSLCGIKRWADLDKPLTIPGWRPKHFCPKEWFNLAGRTLAKSFNCCHPDAISVQKTGLSLDVITSRKAAVWLFVLNYGYPHDSSTWELAMRQKLGEPTERFGSRVTAWLDSILVPESWNEERCRTDRERKWQDAHRSLKTLFYFDGTAPDKLATRIASSGNRSPRITPARLRTLKRWLGGSDA